MSNNLWSFRYKMLLSLMRKSQKQLTEELENLEAEKTILQREIDKYQLGLISTNQHKMNKKFRAKLNKDIKELKRELELNQ